MFHLQVVPMVGKTWFPHNFYSFHCANTMRNLVKGGSIGPVKHKKSA